MLHDFTPKHSWRTFSSKIKRETLESTIRRFQKGLTYVQVEGVIGLHDLHVWQLVDGMTIASVHVLCEEGSDFSHLVKDVKKVFHDKGIHSSSIQPEFVPRNNAVRDFVQMDIHY